MMGETLYRKRGRRYEPIAWHEEHDQWPEGATLLVVTRTDGCTSMQAVRIRQDVNSSHLLTLMALKSKIADKINRAQRPKMDDVCYKHSPEPKRVKLTDKELEVYELFQKTFKKKLVTLDYPRLEEVIDEAICEVMNWGKHETDT